ncbi:TRAP-type C4-dicarboxylate transport system substrate-binding protein [Hoeflea halophila]|uniref:TRAP-type C4-dicarboxylate transport system substrate-binding protein n=1 Tax=Hoeflea halophila TaxID=714899 RepID=A0A286HUL1_9HYPH|nr:TRAP transporter substrate-binding protein [Hoeflea halophila]SOE11472.1 TRAP-type C4-dicarboxylate transport system substrate-binding protein [Hoeflea halophila]
MRTLFAKTLVAGLFAATFSTSALTADWDMPTPYPDATFHTVNINQFADDIRNATDGGLNITVHSAGSLIKHGEIKNAVRGGQVQIGEFFLSLLANEDAAYGVDSQPFVATSYDDAKKLWDAQKPVITELLARQKLVPLYAVPWPPQGLYTNKEIATVDDLKGLKFRSYNAALEKFASLAGAAPTQVEVPDIPQAFSTGQVEAMITSPSTGANGKAWDYVSHYTPINAWVPKNIVVVNKAAFEALDEATRSAVLEAAAAAEARGWEMSMKETDVQTAVLKENGMSVVEPSAELLEGLMKIGEQMQAEWQDSASEQAKSIVADFAK